MARGFIDDQACRWLELKAEQIATEKAVSGLTKRRISVNYDECVKIVALHHHPVDLAARSGYAGGKQIEQPARTGAEISTKGAWTTLENRERFLKACFSAKIDLVLFGHQHQFLHREPDENMQEIPREKASSEVRGIHFLSCPTTTQLSKSEKGFFVYSIQPGHFDVEFYSWNEEDFEFKLDRQRSGRFGFHRGRIGFSKSASRSPEQ